MKEQLRVGNKVLADGKIVEVTAIGFKSIAVNTNWPYEYIEYERLSGVPLTEDMLIKAGFSKWDNSCFIFKHGSQSEFILFDWRTPVAIANNLKEGEWYFMFGGLPHTLKHLHTLQNIIYDLTSGELKISL